MSNVVSLLHVANRRREEGNVKEAERLYRQVLKLSPSQGTAAKALGSLLADANRASEAVPELLNVTGARPNDAELQAVLGRCLFLAGDRDGATRALELAAQLDPGSQPGRLWLARCRLASQRAPEAEMLLRPLVGKRPPDPEVLSTMGKACVAVGKRMEAVEYLRDAARIKPSAQTRSDLGYALYVTDRLDEALAEFEAALASDASLVAAIGGKAMILADRRAPDEARILIRSALERGLIDSVLATTNARVAKTPEQRAEACEVLDRALSHPGVSTSDRYSLQMAMGNLLEAEGVYDAAFGHFKAGNDLIGSAFNEDAMWRSAREMTGIFDRAGMDRFPRSTRRDPLTVFIVGMPRSGTTLVEQILAGHPDVHAGGELQEIGTLAHTIPDLLKLPGIGPYPRCIPNLSAEHIESLGGILLERYRRLAGNAQRITDKMPLNFTHLGLIDLALPGARVIHCVRHPLDTCLSCYTTPMNMAHNYRVRLRNLAAVYRMYREVMAHWTGLIRVPVLEVAYEEVVAEPERMAKSILEFVGLPWDEKCLRFHENNRTVRTSSVDQVRRPIYGTSVGRWKHYEGHLGELMAGLKGLI